MTEKFLIGTYTSKASDGIYELEFDESAPKLQNLQLIAKATNPTYVAKSKKNVIYSVDKVLGKTDADLQGGVLVLDGTKRPAAEIEKDLDKGTNPAYITVDEGRQLVFTANYHTGFVNVYKIANDGTLTKTDFVQDKGEVGPRPEQADGAHPHFADLTPDGRLVVVDLGQDRVYLYDVSDDGKLSPVSQLQMPAGYGPRHIAFDDRKGVAYLVGELSSNVAVLKYDHNDDQAQFTLESIHSTIPEDWTAHNGCAAIRVSNDGKFVYVSNRGNNSIAVFSSNDQGELTLIQRISTEGDFPRDFNFTANDKYVIVVNQNTDNASLYQRDADSGKLTLIQKDFTVPQAVCVAAE